MRPIRPRFEPSVALSAILVLAAFGSTAAAPIDGFAESRSVDSKVLVDAGPWTQWRGATRDGAAAAGGEPWPVTLEGLTRQWRVALGKGYAGPIVSRDHAFVVETAEGAGGESVSVRALGRKDGTEVWTHAWPSSGKVPFFAKANGDWVRSTPAYDGKLLYVGDMNEVLVALDGTSGKVVWKIDFPARFGTATPDFGFASSPLIDGDALYVQAANSLVKLHARTGEIAWRKLNHQAEIQASGAFSSPIVATVAGRRQLIVQTRHDLFGVDPETGDELWSHAVPNFRGMNILTPVVYGDAVFTSPYRQRSFLYEVRNEGDGFAAGERWSHESTAYMSSPVVIDGHAYVHLGNGRLECLDLSTGKVRWKTESMGRYWSMVHQGDKILALNEQGTLYLIQADPAGFALLDTRKVSDQETWAHLAVAGNSVYVRGLEELSSWNWRAPVEP